ncbi:MAG: aminoglycoside phosphotransferase family protein [Clostridia bacterium]|nr:aminoglycoside phosphotransferase family protein [Clostridia bacterium]
MMHPEKWRETADPFHLPMRQFRLLEVLGYPHAGNDVFHVRGEMQGAAAEAYIKAARHSEANLRHEAKMLRLLRMPDIPQVLECDEDRFSWCVTAALPGRRLSVILCGGEEESLPYMEKWGARMARLHGMRGDFPAAPHRRFMDAPPEEYCRRHGLEDIRRWLLENPISDGEKCLCHGDGHYANVLWENGEISALVDWELAGLGDREFDLAWAMIRRPGQRFMNTEAEYRLFLSGYEKAGGAFDSVRLRWYMVCAWAWFCGIGAEDADYAAWVRRALEMLTVKTLP